MSLPYSLYWIHCISRTMHKLLEDYSKRPVVPVGRINGAMKSDYFEDEDFSSTDDEQEDLITEYEQDFVEKEMKRYAHCMSEAGSVRYCNILLLFTCVDYSKKVYLFL